MVGALEPQGHQQRRCCRDSSIRKKISSEFGDRVSVAPHIRTPHPHSLLHTFPALRPLIPIKSSTALPPLSLSGIYRSPGSLPPPPLLPSLSPRSDFLFHYLVGFQTGLTIHRSHHENHKASSKARSHCSSFTYIIIEEDNKAHIFGTRTYPAHLHPALIPASEHQPPPHTTRLEVRAGNRDL